MKMHDPSFNDPLITQPEPITLILPFMMDILASAGIRATRDEVVRRTMEGCPRIAIVHGGEDQPAQVTDPRFVKKAVRSLWERNALPFPTASPGVCDGITQGFIGMSYTLLSRNLATLNVIALSEAHGYHGALVLTSCDKRPAGEVTGLVQVDLARRRKGRKPFYAVFLPTHVMPERYLPGHLKRELTEVREDLEDPSLKREISDLLRMKLKCNTYGMYHKLLGSLRAEGKLDESRENHLRSEIVKYCCVDSGTCAFMGTGCTSKFVVAAMGLVPKGLELPDRPHTKPQIDRAVEALLDLMREGDPGKSVSSLVRRNLRNAIVAWSAIGGSTNWVLHFPYVAASVNVRVTPAQLAKTGAKTPLLLEYNPLKDKSVFTLAREIAAGKSSGIDTLMKVLLQMGLVDDADTVEGRWHERVKGARDPNNRILFASPLRRRSGVIDVRGNFCESAVFKVAGLAEEAIRSFNDKIYFAVFYHGQEEAQEALLKGQAVLEKLKKSLRKEDLLKTLSYNFPETVKNGRGYRRLAKEALFETLVRERKMRILVVIAGEGPRAYGMPEMFYPSEYLNRDVLLRSLAVLFTDGRYSGVTYGPCIGHCSPEAFDGGGIAAIETGDWVYLHVDRGEIQLLDRKGLLEKGEMGYPFSVLSQRRILSRPSIPGRIKAMRARRKDLPPWVLGYLDSLLPTMYGATPKPTQ